MWQALLANILIPELARALAARHAAGQPPPTAEEILQILHARAAVVVAEGNAFLASLGAPTVPVVPTPPTP
jgi:hypothetical protein